VLHSPWWLGGPKAPWLIRLIAGNGPAWKIL